MEKYLEKLNEISIKNHIPVIKDEGCDFLIEFCKTNKPTNILEIGTAVGYSGSFMLLSSENSFLTTIEKDQARYSQALETFKVLNLSDRVNAILGDAKQEIEKLTQKFDLIFLDGPKGQYLNYLPTLLNLLSDGGTILADNVLYRGMIRSNEYVKHKHRSMITNLRAFLYHIENNENLNTKVLEIGDGIAIIKKR